MIIRILTLFPQMFDATLGSSILQRAREKGLLDIACINIRDYASNKHKKVDDYPYGGGAGMVMTPQPIFDSHQAVVEELKLEKKPRTIYLSPKGRVFNQEIAQELAQEKELVFLCGHYEGIDQRVIDELVTDEISIGDYVLTGGEIPAMVVIDALSRMIPGVLSQEESYEEESFYSGVLEYPHYTRPAEFRGLKVPDVLMSGNHKNIDTWRRKKSLEMTMERRPDLMEGLQPSKADLKLLAELKKENKK
ncbi:tRNA (guanosine(37)-N1)-methyltransferase TrmD [Alkaliphilus hydrothermalis]|uniref:tRNA (guanine-N(1)-)-methyltransferase n=1 Tax=Alkaliphilus hydrothermalis TaxID=1482730 RepID=A0ABS2NL22_9FIRM|nr:tRNA (guanosine(37)-N1)-methyltransferase TrmD [Alkaliphilus hydrothermalis]MBM7613636.1 tRNA (guanine37-N1)-methyltransferase [Alkaliphilus hydrothermalis]